MKNKKILSVGVVISTIAPLAMVVSCGSGENDKELNENLKFVEDSLKVHKNLTFTGGNSITSEHLKILLGLDKKIGSAVKLSCVQAITKGSGATDTTIQLSIGSSKVHTTTKTAINWNEKVFLNTINVSYQKIDDTHYWIVGDDGVYQMALDKEGKIFSAISYTKGTGNNKIPSCNLGFSQKIDDTHYLIGTAEEGVYQIELDKDTKLIKTTKPVLMIGANSIPKVLTGFCQKIDDTHYLIGTSSGGVYQVTVDSDTGMVTKSTKVPMTGNISIPNVQSGFSQKIDDTHYLIGSMHSGVYQVTVDSGTGMVTKSTLVESSLIPSTLFGCSQKIDDTHYLIGTHDKGVYQVTVDSGTGMVTKSEQYYAKPTPPPIKLK